MLLLIVVPGSDFEGCVNFGWPSTIEARTPWITAGVPLSEVGFPMLPTNKDVNSIAGEEDACKKGSKRIHEVVFLGPDSVIKHTIEYVLHFHYISFYLHTIKGTTTHPPNLVGKRSHNAGYPFQMK